jgi:prophage antirepressor-like protein
MSTALIPIEPQQDDGCFIFEHPEFGKCHCKKLDDEIIILGKDGADLLFIKNHRHAIKKLDPKGVVISDILTPGGRQKATFLTEGGFNELAMHSRKPEALVRKRWICYEVMPTLRKTGAYFTQPQIAPPQTDIQSMVAFDEGRLELIISLVNEQKALILKNRQLETQKLIDAPRVEFAKQMETVSYDFKKVCQYLPTKWSHHQLRKNLLEKKLIYNNKKDDCPWLGTIKGIRKEFFILRPVPCKEPCPYKIYNRLDFTQIGISGLLQMFMDDGIETSQQKINEVLKLIMAHCKSIIAA